MSKDNIMKLSDGLFHKVFNEVAADYPDIATDHYIIDIGAARLATAPNRFDVIVTENLYGDIISDIAAEVSGSVGLAGSANIGNDFAMFEAIHGSAPDIAGRGIANPSGLLNGAIMMLVHLGQHDVANTIHNAWLRTLEEGIHTKDIFSEATHHEVGTMEFAKAVVEHFGEKPKTMKAVNYEPRKSEIEPIHCKLDVKPKQKKLVGFDMFVEWRSEDLDKLGKIVTGFSNDRLECHMLSCKGLKVWPGSAAGINLTDHYNCRFQAREGVTLTHEDLIGIMQRCHSAGIDFIKTENLYTFNGEPGYSLGQGE
jgi:isocitrate dehydrogenase